MERCAGIIRDEGAGHADAGSVWRRRLFAVAIDEKSAPVFGLQNELIVAEQFWHGCDHAGERRAQTGCRLKEHRDGR